MKPLAHLLGELFNIAVRPNQQAKGIGAQLLAFTLAQLKAGGFHRVELGTGAFGYQLRYYQRLGFRVDGVVKNHFLEHYSEAIYEDGVEHKDMLRLHLKLADGAKSSSSHEPNLVGRSQRYQQPVSRYDLSIASNKLVGL